jgi:signal transduction histidine kinase
LTKSLSDWDGGDWLKKIDEVLYLAEEVREKKGKIVAARRYCDSVKEKLRSVMNGIAEYGLPTDRQGQMIFNLERGLRKWL